MRKLLVLVISLLLLGCSKKEAPISINETDISNKLNNFKSYISKNQKDFNLDSSQYFLDLMGTIVESQQIDIYPNEVVISFDVIPEDVLSSVVLQDKYFSSILDESALTNYIIDLYDTGIEKEKIEYTLTYDDVSSGNFLFIIDLYNTRTVSCVRSIQDSYSVNLKDGQFSELALVTKDKSLALNYYGEQSILFTLDEYMKGQKAIDYLSNLTPINSVQKVSPDTEVRVVIYTIQNLIEKPIKFESPLLAINSDMIIYEQNSVYQGEVSSSVIEGYDNKQFIAILIVAKDDGIVLWNDTLTGETFRIE